MANPTAQVKATKTPFEDYKRYWPIDSAAVPTTFFPGEMIGVDIAGLASHCDDTALWTFIGLWAMQELLIDSTMVVGSAVQLRAYVERPRTFTMPLNSGTASRLTDIGKPVYAVDSGHVGFNDPAALVFANLIGYIVDVHGIDPTGLTGSEVEIEPFWYGLYRGASWSGNGVLVAPATGGKTYGLEVLNKTVLVPNTAAETLTLPAVAKTAPGDHIRFIKTTAAAFAVTLAGNAAENINGANTYATSTSQFATADLYSDGTQWIVVNGKVL